MYLIATNFMLLVPKDSYIGQPMDYLIVPTLIITFREARRRKDYFSIKNDKIAKILMLILAYILYEVIRTVVFGIDSIGYIVKESRIYLLYLLFFYIRIINIEDIRKFVKLAVILSFIHGVLYLLQFVGINLLIEGDDASVDGNLLRFGNFPILAPFIILYYLFDSNVSSKKKILCISFFAIIIVLSQTRSLIFSVIGSVFVYLMIQRKTKYLPHILVGYIFYTLAIAPVLSMRDNEKDLSTKEEISAIFSGDDITDLSTSGNFTFRVAMLVERWFYLEDNPSKLLQGVGCIHEQSSANKFVFAVGTINERNIYGHLMLDSPDIMWPPLLIRYGIIGILLWLLLYHRWIMSSVYILRRTANPLLIAVSLSSVQLFLVSTSCNLIDRGHIGFLLVMLICIGTSCNTNIKENG